ncbi:hypothetical protein SNEBB_007987 [Seison nebaliae]|nr:hypothetical protein SNEBB_007987 [Seison nebaliae]
MKQTIWLFSYIVYCMANLNNDGTHHLRSQAHNEEHIKEHLKEEHYAKPDEMSQDDQNFYYFKLHDYDHNNKLDGIELSAAFSHVDNHEGQEEKMTEEKVMGLVDHVLKEEDANGDGYITYDEFLAAIKRS